MKIGIDIGGSHIAVAAVNEKGEILQKIEKDIEENYEEDKLEEYIVNNVDNAIQKLSKIGDMEGVGIAVPGNPEGCKIKNLVNLGIKELDFKLVEEKYDVKIKSINDAKAAALAEKEYGAMKGFKDAVFLGLGTGIGGAVFLNNKLLKANRNPGFEIGHMIIEKDGNECNCGKKGCFETYCSMKHLKESLKPILEEIEPGIDISNAIVLKELLEKHLEDSRIQKILNTYMENLIVGLSNVIDIFEPEVICLGGSFVHFKDILYDKLVAQLQERKYVFNKESMPKIVTATLQNDAGMIGATLL